MPVDFGLTLPAGPPKGQINKFTDDLETLLPRFAGHFKSLWMTDHFFWQDDPTYEAWTVISYMAARWPQFDVGPMVLGQTYRNPALVAKMGATLQGLSRGRLIMAIGAAWKEDEHRAYNFPYPSPAVRLEQLQDTLEILKRMWTEPGQVTYRGKHYQVIDAYCEPKPQPVPPILVGGGGHKTMMLAARFADWWNLNDANFKLYSERVKVLKEHCAKIGRDFSTLRLTWFGRMVVGRTEAKAQALAGEWTTEKAFVGTPGQVVEQMRPFVESGVSYFMVLVPGLSDPDVAGAVLQEVLPKLKK